MEIDVASKSSEKPTVVQVKRKRNDEPIESLWLEVTTRPSKRHTPGISDLSLDSTADPPDGSAPTKLLFRRVESLSSSGVKELSLPQLLEKVKERKRPREAGDNRQTKKTKDQDITRTARFEQVRKSRRRKENSEHDDSSGRELFHLYEVVRVDVEAESAEKAARREKAKRQFILPREAELTEGQLLCNYLPLLREHLPDLAFEIDAAASASTSTTADVPVEEYVYDVYTLDEDMEDAERLEASIPTIQVLDHQDYDWRDLNDSDYDSEDSNDENNPNNDYPEEEDELSGDGFLSDSSGFDLAEVDPYTQGSEEYDTVLSDDERSIWKPRK
ncbi:hypothetical protein MPTK1_2g20410 [Marchantia polymorpha subsp. ruderalis]|uniref:Probable RNA polymerase II nuclear localization protein SLC7A6OS n=1 Tax=Marchantia polymorpha TaxID=3197 RepID=A0A2R6WV41_MARPO|nr:hypothetical protein MARPO_0055s0007 [Marchantia polymorpha]BBN03065.1 hypothetical protein Mp_2g20410 [Marchantia polymorpha subsp. ruderalis]|eukprot:PTQ37718.1 hypothetical protein MARPO_0055s0007 [Marchantia polymorpha]